MVGGKFGWPDLAILAVPVAYVGFFLSLTGNNASPVGNTAEAPILAASVAPITPLQAPRGLDTAKVALGRKLFEDERLTANGQVSCASCHDLSHGGADSARASTGVSGEPTAVNTPTVFNSGNSAAQFWDGRAATLEEQIDGPLQHPDEMGATWTDVLTVVRSDPDYVSMFFAVYARAPSKERIKDAIATFERSL